MREIQDHEGKEEESKQDPQRDWPEREKKRAGQKASERASEWMNIAPASPEKKPGVAQQETKQEGAKEQENPQVWIYLIGVGQCSHLSFCLLSFI